MKIGVRQAHRQRKTSLSTVPKKICSERVGDNQFRVYAKRGAKVYSYIEISVLIGLLLVSGAVDFIVTGCSSGQGYPKSEADRKLKDTRLLKSIRKKSQTDASAFFGQLDESIVQKILQKRDVIDYVVKYGQNDIADLIKVKMRYKI